MRDHGGNLDWAMATYGGSDWIDLSTGINRLPYPLPPLAPDAWQRLPTRSDMAALRAAAQVHYGTDAPVMVCAGAQAAIQMIPHLGQRGRARVLGPTYNEHAAALRAAGWDVAEVADLAALKGADLAVVVNPNNPNGQAHSLDTLRALLPDVGRLVVDESFGDVAPHLTMLPDAGRDKLLILRSFGKFWGLAGLRLGLVFGTGSDVAALAQMAGPWPVAGPAIAVATAAYADAAWAAQTRARLATDARRMDDLAQSAGWRALGGTDLFRLYDTPDAAQAQGRLARAQIWSRVFPYSATWLRLGPPGGAQEWARLAAALG